MDELDKRDREIYMQRNIADVAPMPVGAVGDELPEEEQVTEAALMADASFARNSRTLYQFIHGKPFEGSDVEAGRYGIDAIGEVYWNLTGQRTGGAPLPFMGDDKATADEKYLGAVPMFTKIVSEGSPDQAAAVINMLGQYDRLPNNTARGWFRAIRGVMHDGLTYAGFGGLAARGAAAATGRLPLIQAVERLARQAVENRFKLAGVAGAGYTAAYDVGEQMAEIKGEAADPSLGMSPGQRAARSGVSTGVGAALGPAMAAAGEGAIRGVGAILRDTPRMMRSELGAIGPDVQAQIIPGVQLSKQPKEVLDAIKADKETAEIVRTLAGEKRTQENVGPGDDYDILYGDELLPTLRKMSEKQPGGRKQDELGFFSRAQEFIDNLQQEKLSGPQLKSQMLNAGVKADELKWTGLDEYLDANPKLTKQEAMDFIDQNKVNLEEITYQGGTLDPDTHSSFTGPDVIDDPDEMSYLREIINDDLGDQMTVSVLEDMNLVQPGDEQRFIVGFKKYLDEGFSDTLRREYPDIDPQDFVAYDQKLEDIALERYYGNPYYEILGEGIYEDYRIVGNDDAGYYITYRNEPMDQNLEAYSINEAQVQVQNDAMERGLDTGAGETQYSAYTQEGAENYREVLLTNPGYKGDPSFKLNEAQEARLKELGDKLQAEKERRPSQIVVRASEAMSMADANEFEALQKQQRLSNVMENRMPSPHWQEDDVVAHARLSDRTVMGMEPIDVGGGKRRIPNALYIEELQSDWAQVGRRRGFGAAEKDFYIYESKDPRTGETYFVVYDAKGDEQLGDAPPIRFIRGEVSFATRKQAEEAIEYEKKMMPKKIGTPEGPLVGKTDKWTEMSMRRLIRKAADEGYDYIAWTPGDVQVDRWGEEGLAPFYDKVMRKATEKVAKGLDKEAKVKPIEISIDGYPQETLALPITDKLKTMAKKGQPLFAVPAAAGVGAALKPKEETNGDT